MSTFFLSLGHPKQKPRSRKQRETNEHRYIYIWLWTPLFPPNRRKSKHPKPGHTGKLFYTTAYRHTPQKYWNKPT